MALHLLSDLHLDPSRPQISARFIAYLQGPARQADAVFILGDLFEVWAGDDVSAPLYRPELAAMKSLTQAGVPLYFICGNRDFLCAGGFEQASGAQIVHEPFAPPGRTDVQLMHGDILCTDDVGYQRFRRIVRWPWLQWLYRHLPRNLKLKIASRIRGTTQRMTRLKAEDILDVNAGAVDDFFKAHPQCRLLIHGHTHRPAAHPQATGQTRLVLSDWSDTRGEYLSLDMNSWQRHMI